MRIIMGKHGFKWSYFGRWEREWTRNLLIIESAGETQATRFKEKNSADGPTSAQLVISEVDTVQLVTSKSLD